MIRYTIITGGTEGIGLELAILFAKDRHDLIIIARDKTKLRETKEFLERSYKIRVITFSIDLSVDNSCKKLYEYVDKYNVTVDNLINNAGVGSFGYFNELNIKDVENLIKININSLTELTYYFLNKMIEQRHGGILNVASTAAFSAGPKMSTYYASKAYVLSLTESIHEEVKKLGIRVSCLCPGAVDTAFQKKSGIKKSGKTKSLLMDSKDVAKVAYKEFKEGKAVIIPGYKNKLLIWGNKLIARSLSRKLVFKANK